MLGIASEKVIEWEKNGVLHDRWSASEIESHRLEAGRQPEVQVRSCRTQIFALKACSVHGRWHYY